MTAVTAPERLGQVLGQLSEAAIARLAHASIEIERMPPGTSATFWQWHRAVIWSEYGRRRGHPPVREPSFPIQELSADELVRCGVALVAMSETFARDEADAELATFWCYIAGELPLIIRNVPAAGERTH